MNLREVEVVVFAVILALFVMVGSLLWALSTLP